MSEVLIEYAAPLLGDNMPIEEYRGALIFAAAVWNLDSPMAKDNSMAENELRKSFQNAGEENVQAMESMYHYLLARKKAHFSDIQRLIMDVVVTDRPNEYHVQVLSVPLDE